MSWPMELYSVYRNKRLHSVECAKSVSCIVVYVNDWCVKTCNKLMHVDVFLYVNSLMYVNLLYRMSLLWANEILV